MKEIKCPHCQTVFTIDESEYSELLNQVKNEAFNEELERRVGEMKKTSEAVQNAAIVELKASNDKALSEKDSLIESLKQTISNMEQSQSSQIELAVTKKEQELNTAFSSREQQLNEEISKKKDAISELNAKLFNSASEKDMAVMQARNEVNELVREKETEIIRLKGEAELNKQKSTNELSNLRNDYERQLTHSKEQHQRELDAKDEIIAQYKDFKARMSTKMIGESLEVYCNNQFENLVRPYLPTAEFHKDNEIIDGTKGDFVFRDFVDGIESVSIMFEMKNEADNTDKKHKNSEFFTKLDSDRKKKKCEYAVLVSLLELDNDLYNNGIYTVPDQEKMFVVRPQQFLTIISLLVQSGRKTVAVKKELEEAKNREIDVTNFEAKLTNFKDLFTTHLKQADDRYEEAIDDIEDAIKNLCDMRDKLRKWKDHLYQANKKIDDITIRKLTYKNPTMKKMLDEARKENTDVEIISDAD